MKMAKSLGFFVALALVGAVGTACGTSKDAGPQQAETPEQTVTLPGDAANKDAEPKSQGGAGEEQKDPNQPVSNTPEANKSATNTPAANGGQQHAPTQPSGQSAPANSSAGSAGNSGAGTATGNAGAAAPAAPAPAPGPAAKPYVGTFQLFVTENFGQHGVINKPVGYRAEESLLDVMRNHLEIETAYGGGFVNSINGTKSGYTDKNIFTRKKRDWFYYVNGSISEVGADAYPLQSGSDFWWDYHDWSGTGSTADAVIGSYPHPFTVGYNGARPGTVIYYGAGHAEAANRIASALQAKGAGSVRTAAYGNEDLTTAGTNTLVVGTWAELGGQSNVANLFGEPKRTGLYASFEGDAVTALSYDAKGTDTAGQAAILATGTGSGDTTPTWFVIGATEAGLDTAIHTLIYNHGALRGKVGAVISNGSVVAVPVAK